MVSFSSNNVPSTSQAMSAGNIGFVTETSLRRSAFAVHGSQPAPSVQSALVLPRSGHAIGPVPLRPLLQFRQSDRPGVFLARRAATQPPRHPILPIGMGIFRLHSIEQLIHRVAQRDVELLWGAVRRQRPTGGHGDRNFVAEHLLWMIFWPNPMGTPDNHGNDRRARIQGHPRCSGFEFPQLETAADGGFGMHSDEFALA